MLTKTSSIEKYDSVNLGDKITYTITVENKSDNNYKDIVINDEKPTYTSISSISNTGTNSNGKLSWKVNVNSKQKVTVSYTVSVIKNIIIFI